MYILAFARAVRFSSSYVHICIAIPIFSVKSVLYYQDDGDVFRI